MNVGSKEVGKWSNHEEKRKALLKYSEYILNGHTPQFIYEKLHKEFGFDMNQSLHFYNETKDTIAESVVENNHLVVDNHIELYEDVFKRCTAIDDVKISMKALKQKEELLKLFETETTEVVVNQQTNIFTQNTYDPESKLEPEEQGRLLLLLNKASQ